MNETELRYRVPESALDQLGALRSLGLFEMRQIGTIRMTDIYLDTRDTRLKQSGYSLRLRSAGNEWFVTLKGTPTEEGALICRSETEIPLAKPWRNPERWPTGEPRDTVLACTRGAPLEVLTRVRQRRERAVLSRGSEQIAEYSLDRVDFTVPERRRIWLLECELLPAGTRADLEMVDILLTRRFALAPERYSKLELALAFAAGAPPDISPARSLPPRSLEELALRFDIDPLYNAEAAGIAERLFLKLRPTNHLAPDTAALVQSAATLHTALARLKRSSRSLGAQQLAQQPIEGMPDTAPAAVAAAALLHSGPLTPEKLAVVSDNTNRCQILTTAAIIRMAAALTPKTSRACQLGQITAKQSQLRIELSGAGSLACGRRLLCRSDLWRRLYPTRLDLNLRDIAADTPAEDARLQVDIRAAARDTISLLTEKLNAFGQGVLEGSDPESVHDLRVTSRRLRSALGLFSPALPAQQAADCLEHLKSLTQRLGAVRDAEVMLAMVAAYHTDASSAPATGLDVLTNVWHAQLAAATSELAYYLRGEEFGSLLNSLEELAVEIAVTEESAADSAVLTAIQQHLRKAFQRVLRFKSARDTLPLPQLHLLRIACKRLRYSLESAEIIGMACKPALAQLVALQTHLGDLHDNDITLELIGQALRQASAGDETEALEGYRRYCIDRLYQAYRAFLPAWRAFTSQRTVESLIRLVYADIPGNKMPGMWDNRT